MKSVEELDIFKLSHNLTLKVYSITKDFPKDEQFGLISQMRRASASIPMNLIEGGYRGTRKEFKQFVSVARGSAGELKYQIMLAKDLGYLNSRYEEIFAMCERAIQMLTKLVKALSNEPRTTRHESRKTNHVSRKKGGIHEKTI